MTTEERLRDQLRHFPTLVRRWRGGTAKVVSLTTSHATLTIRIEHPELDGNLQLYLAPPKYYRGPFHWENCCIEVALNDHLLFVIRDSISDLEILTESMSIAENAKPHHRMDVERQSET